MGIGWEEATAIIAPGSSNGQRKRRRIRDAPAAHQTLQCKARWADSDFAAQSVFVPALLGVPSH